MFFKLFFIIVFIISCSLKASEVTVIELHKNKSLDQLVLEQENNIENESTENNSVKIIENENTDLSVNSGENISTLNQEESAEAVNTTDENNLQNLDLEEVALIIPENIFTINETVLQYNLETINQIKSKALNKEFLRILYNPIAEVKDEDTDKKFFIIKKLYDIGEIQKAYNLIREINLDLLSNSEYVIIIKTIELNYLLSTYKLSEACDLKSVLVDESIALPNFLLEKTDIFCLTIDNKLSEAKLLNSLLVDKEQSNDLFFQELLNYTILDNKEKIIFDSINSLKSKDLIFLYSAMLRINELPLTEKFIEIDPINLSIPIILSDSTPMNIRIKAVNKSFYNNLTSVDILSALYQSVDFNSQQFNEPEKTIQELNKNNELIMAFYYQLANRQIFPEDRLRIIMEYWQFSKNIGLEKIAYSLTKNIIDTFTPSSENSKFSMQIALAHISNKNYIEATKWLNFIDSEEIVKSELEYANFLIAINENNELDTIITFLNTLNNSLNESVNIELLETIDVLHRFLKIQNEQLSYSNYKVISDERDMPSYFLIRDIQQNMIDENNLNLLMLSIISMNNKNWHELHPEHLILLLEVFSIYDEGSLIKPIILEILSDLNVIQ